MTEAEIIDIIERGLKVESGSLTPDSDGDNVEEWDSLGQIGILIELNNAFDGKVEAIEEMATANSVASIIGLLKDNALIPEEI